MSIGMLVYVAPDPDLRTFAVAPLTLKTWLRVPKSVPTVSLHAHWSDLDGVLSAVASARSESPLTPGSADWTYAGAADHGAHALSSTSTRALLQSIDEVTREAVAAYVQQRWAAQAGRTGEPLPLAQEQESAHTDELLVYLARLRESCTIAVAKGCGLLMALWEEP